MLQVRECSRKPNSMRAGAKKQTLDRLHLLHGLKPITEAQEPIIEIRHCHSCKAENAPVAIYCHEYDNPLTWDSQVTDLMDKMTKLECKLQMLEDTLGVKFSQLHARTRLERAGLVRRSETAKVCLAKV